MLTAATIKHINQLQQKKYRAEFKEFLVEGVKGVEEALQADAEIILIIIDGKLRDEPDMQALAKNAVDCEIPVDYCSRADIGEIKTTDTFPGVLCVVAAQDVGLDEIINGPIIALDGLKDPGNLGTIIRTADWFGVYNIILAEETVDPYNPKVVRSTMGSIFRTALFESQNLATSLEKLKNKYGYRVVSLEMDGTVLPQKLGNHDIQKTIFLFGSESHGVRPALEKYIDIRYTIPGSGNAESLNVAVAAGIVLSRL
jgi:TrmH family RNA methyltransferase